MNKPKFRAWDTWHKRMITEFGRKTLVENSNGFHYVDLYAKTDGTVIASIKEHKNGEIFTNSVETLPLMQYTGLKDKNGVEIYEGDVLKIVEISNEGMEEYLTDVFWEDASFVLKSNGVDYYDTFLAAWSGDPNKTYPLFELEVIGNIHENPELLNEVGK